VYIIDRFEENWAVIESDDLLFNLPRVLLPSDAGEGDVIKITIISDKEATLKRQQQIKCITDEIFAD
jgi:hypothetical protein